MPKFQKEKQNKEDTNRIQEFLHKLLKASKTILEIILVLKTIIEMLFN